MASIQGVRGPTPCPFRAKKVLETGWLNVRFRLGLDRQPQNDDSGTSCQALVPVPTWDFGAQRPVH